MKAFTERNPRVLGALTVGIMAVVVIGIIFLNRNIFNSGYQVSARFSNAAGIGAGTNVLVAGVKVGTVTSVKVDGNAVDATMSINHGTVLPHYTQAAVQVETLLGVVDVALQPVSGWSSPLRPGAMITNTSVPEEFYQVQNTAGHLLTQTNAKALNNIIESLATITQGKQQQVAQIIKGLGALTTTVDQRSGEVSQLIDSANTVSSTLNSRDQQLTSVLDNLNTVTGGLANQSGDLASLIDNIDQMATQTNSLVGQDRPQLNSLLQNLHQVLGVVSTHQVDVAQGVSYLGSALKGFASVGYSGPNNTPNTWANIYTNAVTLPGGFGVLGPCGALDQSLTAALGPDPLSCSNQTGPLPSGSSSSTPSGGNAGGSSGSGSGSGSTSTSAPNSGAGGLSQLLGPVLGGKGTG
ncbi:MAG TPA: MlaD family protein [Acidimicrobiales bacterium]|jgi:phospholipid/cholesterol/gamma-HCH transport system substrate-binding protein|nr:MlaD family protein [Acidimicrobiales bacterium]